MKKNGFKLTTEPIERWLTGCGCTDLRHYYFNKCDSKRKSIIDKMYHEFKRLNLPDNRCVDLLSIMEDTKFVMDKDKKRTKIKTLVEIYDEKEKEKERKKAYAEYRREKR